MDIKQGQQVQFFDKKTGLGANVNEVLPQEVNKPMIKKFKIEKVYARFNNDIWGADLPEMGSLPFKIELLNIYCV